MEPNPGMFLRVGSDADDDEPDSLVGASPAPVLRMCGSIDAYSHRFNGPVIREKSSALPELTMYRARAVPQPASEGQAITLCCSQVHPSTVRVRCSARAVVSEECLEGTVDGFLNLSIHDERAADYNDG